MASLYQINKGINRPIEFKGLKAQYILYFVLGVLGLLMLFAILYIAQVNSYACIVIVLSLGAAMTVQLYAMSNKYGEHGLTKLLAKRRVPRTIKLRSRQLFEGLSRKANKKT